MADHYRVIRCAGVGSIAIGLRLLVGLGTGCAGQGLRAQLSLAALSFTVLPMTDAALPHPPKLTFITRFVVDVGPPIDLGESIQGRRRFVPVVGGTLAGPYLSGHILTGGGDWQTIRPDGVIDLAARYTLELADGTRVEFSNQGLRHDETGEATSDDYFQTTACLTAPLGVYQWLTRTVFVAGAERHALGVHLELFALGDFSTA